MARHCPETYKNNPPPKKNQVQKPTNFMPERAAFKEQKDRYTWHYINLVKYLVPQIAMLQQYFLKEEENHPEGAYLLEQGSIVMNLACESKWRSSTIFIHSLIYMFLVKLLVFLSPSFSETLILLTEVYKIMDLRTKKWQLCSFPIWQKHPKWKMDTSDYPMMSLCSQKSNKCSLL